MHMNDTITITRKGQATLPIEFRRLLGLDKSGGKLRVRFNKSKNELTILKATNAESLSERLSSYIKPGTEPVQNVDEFYQEYR